MRGRVALTLCAALWIASVSGAQHEGHAPHEEHGAAHDPHPMTLDTAGMVMNANRDRLPRDCPTLAGDVEIHVLAGREFAAPRPGLAYGYDASTWRVPPCSRVTVTLENRDAVRHQWMVHGLPRYLYPMGMFTIEVHGPASRSASFIVPSADQTYLAHCDVPHHMEKGMKGQLIVGAGSGDLASLPGVSAPRFRDSYPSRMGYTSWFIATIAALAGLLLSLVLQKRSSGA